MKKRFSKRRLNLKKAERSGSGAADVQNAKSAFEEMRFLFWLIPHIRARSTKTNLSQEIDKDSEYERSESENDESDNSCLIDGNTHSDDDASLASSSSVSSIKKRVIIRGMKESSHGRKQKWKKNSDLEERQFMEAMKNAVKIDEKEKTHEDEFDLFGKLVATELRKMTFRDQIHQQLSPLIIPLLDCHITVVTKAVYTKY